MRVGEPRLVLGPHLDDGRGRARPRCRSARPGPWRARPQWRRVRRGASPPAVHRRLHVAAGPPTASHERSLRCGRAARRAPGGCPDAPPTRKRVEDHAVLAGEEVDAQDVRRPGAVSVPARRGEAGPAGRGRGHRELGAVAVAEVPPFDGREAVAAASLSRRKWRRSMRARRWRAGSARAAARSGARPRSAGNSGRSWPPWPGPARRAPAASPAAVCREDERAPRPPVELPEQRAPSTRSRCPGPTAQWSA